MEDVEKKKKRGHQGDGGGGKHLGDRKTGKFVRETTAKIDRDIPKCWKAICEALEATKWVNVKGEWIEVPDHFTRVGAAKIGLSKRIPDVARTEHTGKDGKELELGIVYLPSRANG